MCGSMGCRSLLWRLVLISSAAMAIRSAAANEPPAVEQSRQTQPVIYQATTPDKLFAEEATPSGWVQWPEVITAQSVDAKAGSDLGQQLADPDSVFRFTQGQRPLTPRSTQSLLPETPLPRSAERLTAGVYGAGDLRRSLLEDSRRIRLAGPSATIISGQEAATRVTSDAGSLIGKSASSAGVTVQRRTPIVTDP